MNRAEFQSLSLERAEDARALLQSRRYASAYYIAGYAIECGLKAAIARQRKQDDHYSRGQKEAEEIVAAVTDNDHGILQWLKRKW
jgi:hypothetical protein